MTTPAGAKPNRFLSHVDLRLTADDVAELEAAVPQDEIAGERYAPAKLSAIDR